MGVSTDAQLCYGVLFDEFVEFPWDDFGIDGWWLEVNNYQNPHPSPYDEQIGGYKDGVTGFNDPRVQQFHRHRREWLENNPIPIELVNYCSDECPMWILAVPESIKIINRGYPKSVTGQDLSHNDQWKNILEEFCKKYELQPEQGPEWFISSCWS